MNTTTTPGSIVNAAVASALYGPALRLAIWTAPTDDAVPRRAAVWHDRDSETQGWIADLFDGAYWQWRYSAQDEADRRFLELVAAAADAGAVFHPRKRRRPTRGTLEDPGRGQMVSVHAFHRVEPPGIAVPGTYFPGDRVVEVFRTSVEARPHEILCEAFFGLLNSAAAPCAVDPAPWPEADAYRARGNRSLAPGDVIGIVEDDGRRRFYAVAGVGFTPVTPPVVVCDGVAGTVPLTPTAPDQTPVAPLDRRPDPDGPAPAESGSPAPFIDARGEGSPDQ